MVDKNLEILMLNLPVFSKLTPQERNLLATTTICKKFKSEEYIALQGEVWPYVFVLINGEIRVQKTSSEGRNLGSWRLSSAQIFWSPSVFDGNPLPASLETSQICEICMWNKDRILPIIQKNHLAVWDLCVMLIQRIRQASDMVQGIAFQPLASRLASLLINQYDGLLSSSVKRSMTLDEMASMMGTTPVMVCKLLSRFAEQEIIKVSRSEFEFIDKEKLTQIAERNV